MTEGFDRKVEAIVKEARYESHEDWFARDMTKMVTPMLIETFRRGFVAGQDGGTKLSDAWEAFRGSIEQDVAKLARTVIQKTSRDWDRSPVTQRGVDRSQHKRKFHK